jgi:hypothetical protein
MFSFFPGKNHRLAQGSACSAAFFPAHPELQQAASGTAPAFA